MKLEVEVCDVCHDPRREVKEYTVSDGSQTAKAVLCPTHSGVLESVLGHRKRPGRAPAAAKKVAAKRRSNRVATIEQIEKSKKKA